MATTLIWKRPSFLASKLTSRFQSTTSVCNALFSWGRGNDGALGHPVEKSGLLNSYEELLPKQVEHFNDKNISKIDFGLAHSAAIDSEGKLYTWGQTKHHRLGHGDSLPECLELPIMVESLSQMEIVDVACGEVHTAAIDSEGRLYTWGWGGSLFTGQGPLGLGGVESHSTPKLVESLVKHGVRVQSVATGELHTLALTKDGEVWIWGNGEYGRLGNLGSSSLEYPEPIEALQTMNVKKIACGHAFSMILNDKGQIFSWGKNDHGQLGLGGGIAMDVYSLEDCPRLVEGLEGVADIAAGSTHAAAVTEDGSLFVWGMKSWFEPHKMTVLQDYHVKSVSCGTNYTAAVTACGKLFTFGKGRSKCLGHGDSKTKQQPEMVKALESKFVSSVSCGHYHIGALVGTRNSAVDTDFSFRN